jgi:putative addiction module component (TIGR02574 family)
MATASKILEQALALTPDQRVHLVQELLESLDEMPGVPRESSVDAIRAALIEGEASGIAEDSSLDGVVRQFRASRTPLPPPGFAQLSVSEKVEYIQALWDGLSEAEVTAPESQRDGMRARLEEHQQSSEAGCAWGDVKRDIEGAMLHAALEQSVA